MKRLLIILILILSPVWCSTILGMNGNDSTSSTQTSETEVAATPGDSVMKNMDSLANNSEAENIESETDNIKDENSQTNSIVKEKTTDWYALIIALVALGVSIFVYLDSKKNSKNKNLEDSLRILNKKIGDNRTDIEALQRKIDLLEYDSRNLDDNIAKIYQNIHDLKSKISVQTKTNKQAVTPSSGNIQSVREEMSSPYQISYISSLSMDDSGELTIPIWSLDQNNTQALFRVKYDPSSGTGFYELNPNVDNISTKLDTLKTFSDGVKPSKLSGYKTKEAGKLRKEGGDLKVITRLKVE
ncbi:MAG: hypothetical protein K2J82_06275 [Muribaculaceae bacterium]|nr:hypothetical protein [Muribaculaceae bacterium]